MNKIIFIAILTILIATMCCSEDIYLKWKSGSVDWPKTSQSYDTEINGDSWVITHTYDTPAIFVVKTAAQCSYEHSPYLLGIVYGDTLFNNWYSDQDVDTMSVEEFKIEFNKSIQLCAPSGTSKQELYNVMKIKF